MGLAEFAQQVEEQAGSAPRLETSVRSPACNEGRECQQQVVPLRGSQGLDHGGSQGDSRRRNEQQNDHGAQCPQKLPRRLSRLQGCTLRLMGEPRGESGDHALKGISRDTREKRGVHPLARVPFSFQLPPDAPAPVNREQ